MNLNEVFILRVIAGIFGGRKLKIVSGTQTRPTTDRIKESVFQMMGPFFRGGICLDLFAGSGSLGIEALSRGFSEAVFIDRSKKAIQTIRENIQMLGIEDRTQVVQRDALRYLHIAGEKKQSFDLILLDPPYKRMDYEKLIQTIQKLDLLKAGGFLYCEHDPNEEIPLHVEGFTLYRQTAYGQTTKVTIYQQTTSKE